MAVKDTDCVTMDNVLTLIAGPGRLDELLVSYVDLTLRGAGAAVAPVEWLNYGMAADLHFRDIGCQDAIDLAFEVIEDAPIDAAAQPAADRRKRMLIADMESTIIENEMLDELAEEADLRPKIEDITARAMHGELDFFAALRERVSLLAGLDEEALERTRAKIHFTPGAKTLVATMHRHGAFCALVSGGFSYYTRYVRETLGFDTDQSNRLEIKDGKLTGEVIEPILGPDAKREKLLSLSAEKQIPPNDVLAVGDGANDLHMLDEAGLGVAYHAKPVTARAADARIDHADLTALLYLQGYTAEEFVD